MQCLPVGSKHGLFLYGAHGHRLGKRDDIRFRRSYHVGKSVCRVCHSLRAFHGRIQDNPVVIIYVAVAQSIVIGFAVSHRAVGVAGLISRCSGKHLHVVGRIAPHDGVLLYQSSFVSRPYYVDVVAHALVEHHMYTAVHIAHRAVAVVDRSQRYAISVFPHRRVRLLVYVHLGIDRHAVYLHKIVGGACFLEYGHALEHSFGQVFRHIPQYLVTAGSTVYCHDGYLRSHIAFYDIHFPVPADFAAHRVKAIKFQPDFAVFVRTVFIERHTRFERRAAPFHHDGVAPQLIFRNDNQTADVECRSRAAAIILVIGSTHAHCPARFAEYRREGERHSRALHHCLGQSERHVYRLAHVYRFGRDFAVDRHAHVLHSGLIPCHYHIVAVFAQQLPAIETPLRFSGFGADVCQHGFHQLASLIGSIYAHHALYGKLIRLRERRMHAPHVYGLHFQFIGLAYPETVYRHFHLRGPPVIGIKRYGERGIFAAVHGRYDVAVISRLALYLEADIVAHLGERCLGIFSLVPSQDYGIGTLHRTHIGRSLRSRIGMARQSAACIAVGHAIAIEIAKHGNIIVQTFIFCHTDIAVRIEVEYLFT